ncbi:MAG TPA: DinB family protein [Gemmatimonadaceae bacterium]|nr:DinB family protein [Gemmatimonadaceae bacterium]
MSTLATSTATTIDPALAARIVREGYGPGAWHGPDLRAAIADVSPSAAFWRPAPDRHNIAEIVVHHAFYVRSVIERLGGTPAAFPFTGEDWFALDDERAMSWAKITALLDDLQSQLAAFVATPIRGEKTADEQMDLLLGITCHAVYHAGQIQLLKALGAR